MVDDVSNEPLLPREPDTYIIVVGDKDYYEKVATLLESGFTVRLVVKRSGNTLARIYEELLQQREQIRFAEGYQEADFFVDDLEKIVRVPSTPTLPTK